MFETAQPHVYTYPERPQPPRELARIADSYANVQLDLARVYKRLTAVMALQCTLFVVSLLLVILT